MIVAASPVLDYLYCLVHCSATIFIHAILRDRLSLSHIDAVVDGNPGDVRSFSEEASTLNTARMTVNRAAKETSRPPLRVYIHHDVGTTKETCLVDCDGGLAGLWSSLCSAVLPIRAWDSRRRYN